MKALLKKWWKKSQARAIGFEFTTEGRWKIHVEFYLTWLGVFIWGTVLTWWLV